MSQVPDNEEQTATERGRQRDQTTSAAGSTSGHSGLRTILPTTSPLTHKRSIPGPSAFSTLPLPRLDRRLRGRDTTILAAILAVLITISGVLLSAATYNNHSTPGTNGSSATSTAEVATTALAEMYPFSSQLVLDDSLTNASHASEYGWPDNRQCEFSDGAYHALVSGQQPAYCLASALTFSDFTFQVQMTIQGNEQNAYRPDAYGGLILRADDTGQRFYLLSINVEGAYTFYLINGNETPRVLMQGNIPSFLAGFGKANIIAITAQGSHIAFYLNPPQTQSVFSYDDPTYRSGQLGLFAAGGSQTNVAYNNAKVWKL